MSIQDNINNIKKVLKENITLIAVSKTRSLDEMEEAYNSGLRDFGENKVQEFTDKYEPFHKDVRWHIIGHLQTNKVKYIVGKVFLIQSLDSVRLLKEIEKQYAKAGITANTLIEINIGREENKTGLLLENLEELISEVEKCNNVKVSGIMTVIPIGNEDKCREYFKQVKNVFDSLAKRQFNNINMQYLSMGMTGDFKIAADEGSNMVRIGEGIFGKRIYNNQKVNK
ncbi:YggS family pyridoxal phosphate-dependent enzyme [Clostridium oryzae]|uniref:Pyridoxal phosphate homeostasis protein n=1 Tax=Clostridium oryzae TaxID=1450648 RepID=A0A1V4IT95_9CLOT|nr:YggS family pyridoxal phosphate-dependent enzyme [Clostridium oryzae]OPJ63232.1 alanine racemase [Clostridium oryzae]